MGEWSKKIGEVGEKIVFDLLDEIGWGDAQKNVSISCVHGQRHGTENSATTTHGIDGFFSYPSRLTDRTLDHLIISVKFSSNPYPDSPSSKFKDHFLDLAKTMECFRKSSLRNEAGKHFSGIETARNVGVLFWLTNDRSNKDIISKVSNCRKIDDYTYETIFLVDDYKAAFLYDSIRFLRLNNPTNTVEFLHPSTGKNINPTTREAAGKVLPVEYVNSPILPFRITSNDNKKTLVLSNADDFAVDSLRRLLGLAQTLSQEFATNTLILYPDYDPLRHDNFVQEAKAGFANKTYTESVSVGCFRNDYRGGSK